MSTQLIDTPVRDEYSEMIRFSVDNHIYKAFILLNEDQRMLHVHFGKGSAEQMTIIPKLNLSTIEGPTSERFYKSDKLNFLIFRAPMSGKIVALNVNAGDSVQEGDVLLVMESMKMEHSIISLTDGMVESVNVSLGDIVSDKQVMVTFAEEDE